MPLPIEVSLMACIKLLDVVFNHLINSLKQNLLEPITKVRLFMVGDWSLSPNNISAKFYLKFWPNISKVFTIMVYNSFVILVSERILRKVLRSCFNWAKRKTSSNNYWPNKLSNTFYNILTQSLQRFFN